jgi:hypothetical protein
MGNAKELIGLTILAGSAIIFGSIYSSKFYMAIRGGSVQRPDSRKGELKGFPYYIFVTFYLLLAVISLAFGSFLLIFLNR